MEIITLDDFISFLNINVSETDEKTNALLTLACESAEDVIKNYLKYSPASKTYTNEKHSVDVDTDVIQVNSKPITAISSISINGISQDIAGFCFTDNLLMSKSGNKVFVKNGKENIAITYTGGYASIPNLIKLATFEIAFIFYQEQQAGLANKVSFGGETREYIAPSKYDGILKRLEYYRVK